jgi:hypothetical protein
MWLFGLGKLETLARAFRKTIPGEHTYHVKKRQGREIKIKGGRKKGKGTSF